MRDLIKQEQFEKEIRDAYDLEFLVKKAVQADISPEKMDQILITIAALTRQDYNVKLCSLLEADQRPYYRQNNFRILKSFVERLKAEGKREGGRREA